MPEASQAVQGRILDKDRFLIGGNLLLVPFSAGPGVAETDKTERMALMMVKGLTETVRSSALRWHVLNASDAGDADIILHGYITAVRSPSKWNLLGGDRIYLAVEGKVTDARTGDFLAEFRHSVEGRPDEGFLSLAERIGKDLAAFILLEKDRPERTDQ